MKSFGKHNLGHFKFPGDKIAYIILMGGKVTHIGVVLVDVAVGLAPVPDNVYILAAAAGGKGVGYGYGGKGR